jgi:formate hydrogenlyase subunit 6/NADH:ubiquinone oxidoreductase subunit I
MGYFNDIREGIKTTLTGLGITGRHLREATQRREVIGVEHDNYFAQADGLVTVQYPHEKLPIPDNGRYRLHNEIDDCIVCDKCAKICPVDCITIDPIKATEEVGRASDGSPIRLYAATFDIDMAKCCYCGLCTVVCPTECLTMEKTYDYSTYALTDLNYAFANLTPEQADEKRALYEQFIAEKEAAKTANKPIAPPADVPAAAAKPKPVFRPGLKPKPTAEDVPAPANNVPEQPGITEPINDPVPPKPKPAFRPTMKPKGG